MDGFVYKMCTYHLKKHKKSIKPIKLPKTKIVDTPICCPLPNNTKSNPWKTSSE